MTKLEREAERLVPPYCEPCGQFSIFYPESGHVYQGRDYGPIWQCTRCLSRVGCHKGSARPMGKLCDHETRESRKRAHSVFDALWKERGRRFYGCRVEAYQWLQEAMGMTPAECHIGMMTHEQAERVVELSRNVLANENVIA